MTRELNAGLKAYNAQRIARRLKQPTGLTYDLLHQIRRALRTLRKAEQWIVAEHRAEKRRRMAQRVDLTRDFMTQATTKGGR